MIKIETLLTIAGALLALGFSAAPAQAQANRTFVSGTGTDSGACSRAAPCRTFAFALTQTAAGGEIDVLDPAGYGTVIITKAVSIVNDGVGVAGIQAGSGENAITIYSSVRGGSVNLRGLTLDGLGIGDRGIYHSGTATLTVTNCTARHFRYVGISINPQDLPNANFLISNTLISDNDMEGISVYAIPPPGGGPANINGVIDHVWAINNGSGISIYNGTQGSYFHVTIVDSIASNNNDGIDVVDANVMLLNSVMANNTQDGFYSSASDSQVSTEVTVRNSSATHNNSRGFAAYGTLLLSHSVANTILVGVLTGGSHRFYSYGDNDINGNITDVVGILTPLSPR